jgi:hypothetical protein
MANLSSRELVQSWYDKQINGIIKHIDKHLQCLPKGERVVRNPSSSPLSDVYFRNPDGLS